MNLSRRDVGLAACLFLIAAAYATWLHWPALTHYGIYKEDILQSPHWAAYHGTSFQADDPIVEYASFNESPLQNGIYWVFTWFVEYVRLSKLLAVLSYGLLAALFFLVGRAMHGLRFGLLLFLFITFLPDQWEFSPGFFSKFWAIPLLLICVSLLQSGRTRGFIALLPFSALAYPMIAVVIGMAGGIHWLQELFEDRARAMRLFRDLAIGSLLAIALLSVKYVSPPEGIGPMRPGAELRAMPELAKGGYPSNYIPIPSVIVALGKHVRHPFVWLSAAFFVFMLRRRFHWERSWTSLVLASVIGYILADLLFMRLYIPDRYTRYSLPVVLALWNARNWDLILERFRSRAARIRAVCVLVLVGATTYAITFEPDRGWVDRRLLEPVCRFIREELPEGVLIAGSPRRLDHVMIMGKRSVLTPYKLAHPWFVDYYDGIRERNWRSIRAHLADGPDRANALHERYGATHFLVQKWLFEEIRLELKFFANPYNDTIYDWLGERREFYLESPPPEAVLWEDDNYAIIELPIPTGAP